MGTQLHQALRTLCFNTEWKYAVLWKLKHRARMMLTWEDAYYDNHEQHNPPENMCFPEIGGNLRDWHSHDPLGLAVAKMSYHVYPLGEGVIGQVAVTGKHMWISADKHLTDSCSPFEHCDGWQTQFSAGIRTVVVVAVVPHGVIQLGSLKKIPEDLKMVSHIRDVFFALQDSSVGCTPSEIHCAMKSSSCLSDMSTRSSGSGIFNDSISNLGRPVNKDKTIIRTPTIPSIEKPADHSYLVPLPGDLPKMTTEVINKDGGLELSASGGDESAILQSRPEDFLLGQPKQVWKRLHVETHREREREREGGKVEREMQGLKSASLIKRCLRSSSFISGYYRSLSSLSSNNALSDDLDDIVLVEGKAWSRTAILNRPSVLNALNTAVGARLQKLYTSWEDNPDIGFVVLKGSGRAFCAGGDIVTLCHLINEGNIEDCKEFFRTLYSFIYLLGTYLKPHVALLNGITMGGGAGVSIPGTFKVATDKTVFATPETLIGFHPDAGASFYLSHLPGHLGEYLALTGDKLNGVELISCGLATHYSISARLPLIEEQLGKLVTDDPSVVETSLAKYCDIVYPDRASVLHRIETLDKCFSHDTVEEIIDALESEAAKTHDDWCTSTLKKLQHCSPLSLKVSLRSIREGRFQTLDQCLVREYRMSLQGISKQISNDFCEGVRARVVDKDMAPKWNPPNLEQVSKDMVDQYFSPLSEFEPDLELPIKQRETFT